MRLLHTTDLRLKEFYDEEIPRYAILSHRWENEEISLQDFVAIRNLGKIEYQRYAAFLKLSMSASESSAGYRKILRCCEYAASLQYEWVWIDTCCIDRSSSAELSEAINSMYRWYHGAHLCFAYLSDVRLNRCLNSCELSETDRDQLRVSNWFSRGWTLQELLAPSDVVFLDRDWKQISNKRKIGDLLTEITQIPSSALSGQNRLEVFSVAQKMSWAARRKTSRLEDIAYCLLGIFNVNMPLLYGEGRRAFARLQEEILRISDDYSLFLWADMKTDIGQCHGLLAPSPAYFARSYIGFFNDNAALTRPYRVTNRGLEWDVTMFDAPDILCESLQAPRYDTFLLPIPLRPRFVMVVQRELGDGPIEDYQHFSRHSLLGINNPLLPQSILSSQKRPIWTVLIRLHEARGSSIAHIPREIDVG